MAVILLLGLATSCGAFKMLGAPPNKSQRAIATLALEQLLNEEEQSFSREIDEKLKSLHCYYVIAQKNMLHFDDSLGKQTLDEIYQSRPYLNIMAIRTQVDEIEQELIHLNEDPAKGTVLIERIKHFSKNSKMARLSMENLQERLSISPVRYQDALPVDVSKELQQLESTSDFQIYEKNIEHLSHLMELKIKSSDQKFKPSTGEGGNITGEEFPAKVWALTFSAGPMKKSTLPILKNLKDKNLKATFFPLTNRVESDLEVSQIIHQEGMEIGSHSYSFKELSRVGSMTLEKEVKAAKTIAEAAIEIEIRFFRLPFGSGINVPNVRQALVRNNMIHALWNVDTLDWLAQKPDKIIKRTKKLMEKSSRDAGIILFHDINMRSVEASKEIMNHLKQDGRRSCTLGEIVTAMNQGAQTVCSKN
jgi:peptidoglycan/xylan/chitin deacetylase (PgdA/CDA1 family)